MGVFADKINGMFKDQLLDIGINSVECNDFGLHFARTMCISMYEKIFYECADKAILTDKINNSDYSITSYDSFSPLKRGLVSLIVEALVDNTTVYLKKIKIPKTNAYVFSVVDKEVATNSAGEIDESNYLEMNFDNYEESKIVLSLYVLLGNVMVSLSKGITVSKGLIVKFKGLSELIKNSQNTKQLKIQIEELNKGVIAGKTTAIDSDSDIEQLGYDSSQAEKSAKYIFSLISNVTGRPISYINGEVTGGLGDNSKSEEKRLDASTKKYFYSIWAGINYSIYGEYFKYKVPLESMSDIEEAFAFVEITTSLSQKGKLLFLKNYTGMDDDNFSDEIRGISN